MNLGRLVVLEIRFRPLNFLLGVLSVAIAVACLVGAVAVLQKHDLVTDRIVAEKEAATKASMARLEDDVRKITVNMGFNVLILPAEQNLGDLYADDYASHYMPEAYAERLAQSRVATINHVLPSLQQKIKWPEIERTILLMGVRGEVYLHSAKQKPILDPVIPGTAVVGYELHRSLGLKEGDAVTIMGRAFTVDRLQPERGNKDDITVWINLHEAQELLGKPGLINAILALDCTCAGDRLSLIRKELAAILPDTQVIEFASQAIARAEARGKAAEQAESAIAAEKAHRAELREGREALAALLVPLALTGSALWIGFLTLGNVRERRAEIAILRALGLRARQILLVFLVKAAAVGLFGALLGCGAGLAAGAAWGDPAGTAADAVGRLDVRLFAGALAGAPLLAMLASWLPALAAAQQDPADILRGA